ncbi:hypothetical protein [Rhodovulum sp. BSW8]|uniref:hypothetical protein n=1 Tax=Rhodovulum sp. BSW8 TaxID=2259645 RepID=UPI001FB2C147|nr:hypothetical protein [Rhodovulum sp. BSW8]
MAPVLISGPALTPPLELLRVLAGGDVLGASFAVRELRLPRAVLATLAGMGFGLDLGPADDPVAGPAPYAGQRATRPASEEPALRANRPPDRPTLRKRPRAKRKAALCGAAPV